MQKKQIAVRIRILRANLQCPAIARHGIIQAPRLLQGNAQVIVCFGVIRIDPHGPAIACHGLINLP